MSVLRLAAVLLAGGASAPLTAQVSVTTSLGLRYTSPLVRDSIVTSFDVRAALAPALTLTAGTALKPPWTAELSLDVSTSGVSRHDADGTVAPITHLTTLAVGVALARTLNHGFTARGGIGGLKYLPSERTGIFRDGSGAVTPFGQAAVQWAPPGLLAGRMAVEARYDLHRFLTPALRNEGFTNSRVVHRVALAARYTLRGTP
jgi:hypothetical protein